MTMITEKEFSILATLAYSQYLRREDFASDQEFDNTCDIAQSLLTRNFLRATTSNPFRMNNTGKGSRYAIAGKFELTLEGRDIIEAGTYESYLSSLPKQHLWNLDRRLVVLGIIVALLGVFAMVAL